MDRKVSENNETTSNNPTSETIGGFVLYLRSFLPNLSLNLMPRYKLSRKNVEFELQDEPLKSVELIKSDMLQETKTTAPSKTRTTIRYFMRC